MKSESRTNIHALCQKHELTDEQYQDICHLFEAEYNDIVMDKHKADSEKRDVERKLENAKEVLKQTGQRYNAQLMSVFYLLGSVQTVGTHHEKEVVIRFIRTTLDNLLDKNGDRLSWDQDLLPF